MGQIIGVLQGTQVVTKDEILTLILNQEASKFHLRGARRRVEIINRNFNRNRNQTSRATKISSEDRTTQNQVRAVPMRYKGLSTHTFRLSVVYVSIATRRGTVFMSVNRNATSFVRNVVSQGSPRMTAHSANQKTPRRLLIEAEQSNRLR